jgi:hypothetical protein
MILKSASKEGWEHCNKAAPPEMKLSHFFLVFPI